MDILWNKVLWGEEDCQLILKTVNLLFHLQLMHSNPLLNILTLTEFSIIEYFAERLFYGNV